MRYLLAALVLVGTLGPFGQARADERCAQAMVFFDLGDVLIDTQDPSGMHEFAGSRAYVNELVARGHRLGLISNIPESWGSTPAAKILALKNFVAAHWRAGDTPFDWSPFEGRILLPQRDAERKPAPVLFERAMALASACPERAWFEGEDAAEVAAAKAAGLRAYHVGAAGQERYLPINEVR